MRKLFLVLCSILLTAGCSPRADTESKLSIAYGEAVYLGKQCPTLTTEAMVILRALQEIKILNPYASSEKRTNLFLKYTAKGYGQAKDNYKEIGNKRVCELAIQLYGPKGSKVPNVMKSK